MEKIRIVNLEKEQGKSTKGQLFEAKKIAKRNVFRSDEELLEQTKIRRKTSQLKQKRNSDTSTSSEDNKENELQLLKKLRKEKLEDSDISDISRFESNVNNYPLPLIDRNKILPNDFV